MNKGDVKIVANAYVLEGRAKIELGDSDEGQEDIEKAVTFLTKIANVKSANDKGPCLYDVHSGRGTGSQTPVGEVE